MKAKTNKNVKTAEQAAPPERWWLPQLDTPIGRVELVLGSPDQVEVRRAGWNELYEKLHKWPRPRCRDTRFGPPYLDKEARRLTDLTAHLDNVALTRAADGSWKPAVTYRGRRNREIAQMLADAVTAWMAVEAAEKTDLLRRNAAFEGASWFMWMGPGRACEQLVDRLSAEIESGLFDFDDAGHARVVATQAVERLRQTMVEVDAMRGQLLLAITPRSEDKAAA
jgi:hypothetical protein